MIRLPLRSTLVPNTTIFRSVSVSRASASVGPVTPAAPTALTQPRISGDATVGSTLTVDPGGWSDPHATFRFVWQRCRCSGGCAAIDCGVGEAYIVSAEDLGS